MQDGAVVTGAGAGSSTQGAGLRLLIADDNEINREYLEYFLKEAGYDTVAVRDGKLALDVVSDPEVAVRLLVTDMQMPVMDGYQLIRAIRAGDGLRFDPQLPVVALTAFSAPADLETIRDAGADAIITKPFRPVTILDRIGGLLAEHPKLLPSAYAPRQDDPVDIAELVENFNHDDTFLIRSARLFLKNVPRKTERLHDAIESGTLGEAGNAAHSIAGSLGILCAHECDSSVRALMAACREGRTADIAALDAVFMQKMIIFIRFLRFFA